MPDTVKWLAYDFTVHQKSEPWNNVAGIYIFAGVKNNQWVPYYIGQCDSFQNRIPLHEQWDKALALGATHIHARVVPQASDRNRVEKTLIQSYDPDLNKQLR